MKENGNKVKPAVSFGNLRTPKKMESNFLFEYDDTLDNKKPSIMEIGRIFSKSG